VEYVKDEVERTANEEPARCEAWLSPHAPSQVPLIELRNVVKTYQLGATRVNALRGISLQIHNREFVAVWGPSGSGKSTLLNLVGLVDKPTTGSITLNGTLVGELSDREATRIRNHQIGFIFQSFNLVPVLSAIENVMLPLDIRGASRKRARARALELLAEVDLMSSAHARPDQLSGGQRQRVAIARALVTEPKLVIADEPTANLDSENSARVLELMRGLNRKTGATFLFSTHDARVLDYIDRRIRIEDGLVKDAHDI
jgi:putative ABC transport system ATP-binding protein